MVQWVNVLGLMCWSPVKKLTSVAVTLPHSTRRKLSQLRTNKSPLLMTYLHKIDPANHPAANCPLCNDPNHDSLHLFNCPDIPTTLTVWDLWTNPVGVAALLDVWGRSWAGPERGSEILCVLTHGMGSTPPPPPRLLLAIYLSIVCMYALMQWLVMWLCDPSMVGIESCGGWYGVMSFSEK